MIMPREMFEERIRMSNPKMFSWEQTPCPNIDANAISAKTLDYIIVSGINRGRVPRDATTLRSRLSKLDHLGLCTSSGELTNGAIALFGKAPNREFPQCKVRLARFEGKTMDRFRDQSVCYGNLFEQYDAIMSFCQKHMFLAGNMDQVERIDTLTVPLKVVREAAVNLLVHRSWWSDARTPSVAIFDDRIEFMNPGSFPPGTTAEDFRKRPHSEPINEAISNVFYKSGLMEA
jgi:ATP-dependent DNA helicase RecG